MPAPSENLPLLRSDLALRVAVQRTMFLRDSLSRFICNTWDEATVALSGNDIQSGVSSFDAVIVGSGMYGAYCAHQIWRRGGKVLLLEAGPFLLPEHSQNLARGLGFNAAAAVLPESSDGQLTRNEVWGIPWRGNQVFPGLAFCVGGKSLFWGGWSPRHSDDVLADYPAAAREFLQRTYERIELQLGVARFLPDGSVTRSTGFIDETGPRGLTSLLSDAIDSFVVAQTIPPSVQRPETAPVAAQGDNPTSGLFSFDKYSPVPLITEAIREDVDRARGEDSRRNFFLVPNCRILRVGYNGAYADHLEVQVDGMRKTFSISPTTSVVLAASCIESTRLALESFPTAQMGRNLMVHLRSDFAARIPRSAFPALKRGAVETAALHIPGKTASAGRYHIQLVGGANPENNGEAVWFRTVPDAEMLEGILRNDNPEFVSIVMRGIGEMFGVKDNGSPDENISWIDLSQERDEYGMRRAYVHLKTTALDDALWNEMDEAMYAVAERLGGEKTEFWVNGQWTTARHKAGELKSAGGIRDALGTTYHECGTLWMGEAPYPSPTDAQGRFRHVRNAYCADQSLFTRGGSANPVPTGMACARGVAAAIMGQDQPFMPEPGFRSILEFPDRIEVVPSGWRHLGAGLFRRHGTIVEAVDGLGLLVYAAEEFENFELRLQWRAPSIRNNSGVYVRLPSERLTSIEGALISGYEIQIDNTGERPGDASSFPQELNNPFHQTGAVYPVHTSLSFPVPNGSPTTGSIPTRAFGVWNDYEIIVRRNTIRTLLNGVATLAVGTYTDENNTYPRGHVALQNHFKGHGVQFRRVRVREL